MQAWLAAAPMTRLHLFGLDGTLLCRTAAPVEISRQLGLDKETAKLERDVVTGRILERLTTCGVPAAYGSRFPCSHYRACRSAGILTSAAKAEIADRLCAEFGVTHADCVAHGDSLSDAELVGTVPISVAVNADRHPMGLATHSCTGQDLWDAYELVRRAR
ncbi:MULTISPECIES: hydrolase [unclassified Streptomyces]|uniref:hydrolase n=1 Tax=unclassified Streptomyces TaxID=2593676 RepID=UPI00386DD371